MKELKPEEFHELADQLERALFTFESTSNHAVLRLYRKGAGTSTIDESIESLRASADDNSVLMGAESESIFLVYLCVQSYCLQLVTDPCAASSSLYRNSPKNCCHW